MSVPRTAVAALSAGILGLSFCPPATAADPGQLEQVKSQLAEMRQAYEARLQALEKRIAELQQAQTAPPPPVAVSPSTPSSPTSFNPAVSLTLAGSYANLSRNPDAYRLQGFVPTGGEVGPGRRGFGIGESELGISASIDTTFSGQLTASFGADNEVGVEEAWFQGAGILPGGNLRVGRFLSGIGYLNERHAHTWDFIDAPLVHQAFFGGPIRTDGLQLRWVAPADRFVEIGAELGAGSSFPSSGGARNGIGATTLFAHVGDDLGASASWRVGVSLLAHRADDRSYDDINGAGIPVTNSFSGRTWTWGFDGIYKWAPDGNARRRSFTLQGEFFQRRERGTLSHDTLAAAGATSSGDYRATQNGWYLQAVYQFMPMWRVGARYDRLDSGSPLIGQVAGGGLSAADFPILQGARPSRTSVMVDYSPSEFSRFRLQLGADRSNPDATDRQVFLQYIMSLGAHGAHRF
ncbi:MAG: TonB-dependent receptor [Caldimonas sp.]